MSDTPEVLLRRQAYLEQWITSLESSLKGAYQELQEISRKLNPSPDALTLIRSGEPLHAGISPVTEEMES